MLAVMLGRCSVTPVIMTEDFVVFLRPSRYIIRY
jgi:hypothetical protein